MPEISDAAQPSPQSVRRGASMRHWIKSRLGVDKAIGFTIMARGWSSLAGIVTVLLIAHFLTPGEQGYYYTFGSLIALQIVFELGFSFVILQMASHERAHLTLSPGHVLTGDPVAHDRLASVLQKTVRWYTTAAVILGAFLIAAGTHFFSSHQRMGPNVAWHLPWYCAAVAATLTFQLDPLLSFMEGCGFVAHVARLRFLQAAVGSLLAWMSLLLHHGLFAPAMMILGNAAVSATWLSRHRTLLLPLLRRNPGGHKIHWMREVWPFQWRMAVSWLCGYFIFQLYNPVLFAYHGAVVAGQMGMSLSLVNALLSVSISWINTKAAPFGALIARKEYGALDQMFFRAMWHSTVVCIVGAVVIWIGFFYLNLAGYSFAHRVIDPMSLAFLLATVPINVITFAEATYLRAHKQEKFLFVSILGAILVGSSTLFLGKYYSATGVTIGSLAVGLIMGLPLGTYTFLKYRRIWHAK
jgi:hypothetical protein